MWNRAWNESLHAVCVCVCVKGVSNYINISATKKNIAIRAVRKLNSDGFESAWWAMLN